MAVKIRHNQLRFREKNAQICPLDSNPWLPTSVFPRHCLMALWGLKASVVLIQTCCVLRKLNIFFGWCRHSRERCFKRLFSLTKMASFTISKTALTLFVTVSSAMASLEARPGLRRSRWRCLFDDTRMQLSAFKSIATYESSASEKQYHQDDDDDDDDVDVEYLDESNDEIIKWAFLRRSKDLVLNFLDLNDTG